MSKYRVETDGGTYEVETEDIGQPVGNSISKFDQVKTVAKTLGKQLIKPIVENAPEVVGTALAGLESSGVGTIPAMAMSGAGAMGGEIVNQARQAITGDNPPTSMGESLKRQGGAFVRGATAGAVPAIINKAAPIANAIGSKIATGAEKLSGLTYDTPGVLREAFNDPSLIFSKGIEAARNAYETAKGAAGVMRPELEGTLKKMDFVEKSIEIAKNGQINPYEALEARKALDSLKNKIAAPAYRATRQLFDDIAKTAYAGADEAYSRAVKSTALTDFMPKNKTGTPSIGKMILGGVKTVTAPFLSPIVQGAAATASGAIAKPISAVLNSPAVIPVAEAGLSKYFKKK